jgi:hypothetical protein
MDKKSGNCKSRIVMALAISVLFAGPSEARGHRGGHHAGGHGSHGGGHHSGSHGAHHSSGRHSHHAGAGHINRFVNSAVSGAGGAVGRDAVNAVVKSGKPSTASAAPAPASHAAAARPRADAGARGATDLGHCPGFVQAMKTHGDDPAYAKSLSESAPECFAGADHGAGAGPAAGH